MTTEEARIARQVQAIMVRSYVDTQKLNIDVTGTTVCIDGELYVFDYGPKKHDPVERMLSAKRTLLNIERQIRRLPDVSALQWNLKNWSRSGSQWAPKRG
jgi:hypothetical protein